MPVIVYYIDPFLAENISYEQEMLSEALSDLAARLPHHKHYILSFSPQLEMEADDHLQLLRLPLPRLSLRSPAQNRARAFARWKAGRQDVLLVQFSPADWLESDQGKTLLISGADHLLAANAQKTGWSSASCVIVPGEYDRARILEKMPALAGRLSVISPALEEKVEALGWAGQEQIKIKYTGGRDYLLFIGPLSEEAGIIHLMKAYSLFKNWLLTGMPLVLAGQPTEDTPLLEKQIASYKYKNDVLLYTDIDIPDLQSLTAGAYMLVYPKATGHDYPIRWAFSAGTAVVAAADPRLLEWAGDAVEKLDPTDINLLANSMMVLYKDEQTRSRLAEKGRELAAGLSRDATLEAYAAAIQQLLLQNG